METKQNLAKTLKTKRFAIQKSIHLVMREMMRYFDIYLLLGAIIIKGFVFGILQYTSTIPPIIMSILFILEFFFLFTRIALEYHRKKNQQNIYLSVSNNRLKYTLGVLIYIPIVILFEKFDWQHAGLGAFLNTIYYYSNILLASAAMSIHTKDTQFTEKMVGMKKTIVLNSKVEPKIIAEKGTENKKQEAEITVEEEKPETTAMRKKLQNFLYRIKTAKATGDEKTASKRTNDMMKFMEEIEMDFPEMTLIYEQKLQELD